MESVVGVPWRRSDDDANVDGEAFSGKVIKPGGETTNQDEALDANVPRSFKSKRDDYEEHGYTRGCSGCRALLTGTTKQMHSDACRRRMEKEMLNDERVKAAKKRKRDFNQKVTEATTKEAETKNDVLDDLPGSIRAKFAEQGAEMEVETADAKRTREADDESMLEDLAAKVKRRSETTEADGDLDVGALDTNVDVDVFLGGDLQEEADDDSLDPELVAAARREEIGYMKDLGVWQAASMEECLCQTGKPPTSTRWVDVNKGRGDEQLIRSRLVARDFKNTPGGMDTFAATPPAGDEAAFVPDVQHGRGGDQRFGQGARQVGFRGREEGALEREGGRRAPCVR